MSNYRLTPPVIRWGTNLANAVYFPHPLDSVFSGEEPRAGSEWVQSASGFEDSWIVGTDYVLAGTARWLQQVDTLYYPRCTGWDGALGVRAALNYLRAKNAFSWHPDGRNILRGCGLDFAAYLAAAYWQTASDAGLTGVTIAFDSTANGMKIVATNPTGGALTARIYQYVPSIPGESVALSVDYKTTGLSGGATGRIQVNAADASPSILSNLYDVNGLVSAGFARAGGGAFSTVAPAGTAFLQVLLLLNLPAGSAGTVNFKHSLLRRDSTDSTFIDNPSVDSCFLVDPMQFTPQNENDGTRQLALKIRNASTAFDGY